MQNLASFDRMFSDETACKQYLADKRWPDGVKCPRCHRKEGVYALKARPFHWACKNKDCGGRSGYRFSVITPTIFQDCSTNSVGPVPPDLLGVSAFYCVCLVQSVQPVKPGSVPIR